MRQKCWWRVRLRLGAEAESSTRESSRVTCSNRYRCEGASPAAVRTDGSAATASSPTCAAPPADSQDWRLLRRGPDTGPLLQPGGFRMQIAAFWERSIDS